MTTRENQYRLAVEAARLMAERIETEYLHAKERAVLILGIPSDTPFPTNRQIKDLIGKMTRNKMGPEAMAAALLAMRQIAEEIMTVLIDFDPYLIGSTLSGNIREASDIDLHVYADDFTQVQSRLETFGYEDVEEETVDNLKGRFTHLRWEEDGHPVEITIYPWDQRGVVPMSSVTGKAMKRADLGAVRKLLALP